MPSTRSLNLLQLATLLFVALALVPSGTHFFELLNKLALPQEQYMIVQGIYRGWALFGVIIFAALALTIAHALSVQSNRTAMALSGLSACCIVFSLTVFFTFTYPMNVATSNWTVTPADFEHARRQWEYSHAANAVLMFVAFVAAILSVLATRPGAAGAYAAPE
jgi:hypothetical protein